MRHYVHLGLRLDPALLPALDAYVADVQRQIGPWEVRIDRGKALRYLVVSGLRTLGYLPGDAGGGSVEAPVSLGAAHDADLKGPSDTKAAHREDRARTTGRTGRTRAKAVKG